MIPLAFCAVVLVGVAAFATRRRLESRRPRRACPGAPVRRQFATVAPRWPRVLPLTALLFAAGCSHYQLGTGPGPEFHTLYVEPVANQTTLPQAREIVSTRLRDAFARDGRVTLVNSPAEADATLTVAIADYHRSIAAVREDDTGLARKFDLILGVDCTLRTRGGKTVLDRRRIEAVREAFTDAGQLQAEFQTLPLLADALAAKVVHAALDVW